VPALTFLIRAVITLLVGGIAWILLGYATLIALGAIFGWSGHPAIPAVSVPVYVAIYLIALPPPCLYIGWRVSTALTGRRDATRTTGESADRVHM